MPRDIDVLTSATLKHLRERWWDRAFTEFLVDTLRPRAGNRILDVGCGGGTAELELGLLRLSQVRLFAVDLAVDRVRQGLMATRARNIRAAFAAADAGDLPFGDGAFDSTFCVAVLQHLRDVDTALREFARVTRPGGRVLVVSPDNAARYWYSSLEIGRQAFDAGARFFAALTAAAPPLGPRVGAMFGRCGIRPLTVHVFPVSVTYLGPPEPSVWATRQQSVLLAMERAPDESVRRLGSDYLRLLDRYAALAAAEVTFIEIQNTLLFATAGIKET